MADQVVDQKPLRLEIGGPYYRERAFDPPPEGLPVSILETTRSRGLDAQTLLHFVFEVDWATLASGVGINLFSAWLYERFRRPPRDQASVRGSDVEVTVNGNVIIATDPESLERALREVVGGRER
jgi:hypothetical protein